MSFPRFRYQNQLSIDAPSLMASTATPQTVGLPPLPMQPKPNAEQVMILQLIANHLHTDPDYKRRFLHNLLAVQGVTFFRQSAIQLDNHLGPGSISNIELQLSRDLTAQEKAYLHPFLNVQLDVVSSWFQDTAIPGSGRLQVDNTAPAQGRGPSVSLSTSRSPSRNSPRGARSGSRAPAPDHRPRYTCGEHFFGKTCEQCRKGYLLEKGFTNHVMKEHLQEFTLAYIVQTKEQCCRDNAAGVQTLLNHIRISHMGQFSTADLRKTSKHLSPWVVEAPEGQSRRTSTATLGHKSPDTILSAVPYPSHPKPLNTNHANAVSTPVTPNHAALHHQSGTIPDEHYPSSSHIPSSQWPPSDYQQQQPDYGSEGNSFNSPGPFPPWSAYQYPGFQ